MIRLDRCIASTLLLLASPGAAEACSCARPGDHAPVAFEGVAVAVEPLGGMPPVMQVTIRVGTVYRGDVPRLATVRSYLHDSHCGAGEYMQKAAGEGRSLRFDIVGRGIGAASDTRLQDEKVEITFCEVR